MKNLWMIAAFVLTALMIGGCGMFQVMDGDGMVRSYKQISQEEARKMEPVGVMVLRVGDRSFPVDLESNGSAKAFFEKIKEEPLTVDMHDYGNFEKVGDLPWKLETNDERITTKPGDVILYQGDKITIYYDENTWSFTKLGHLSGVTGEELKEVLGAGDVKVEFMVEWTE